MSRTLALYKASDGTAAVDMTVTLVGDWLATKVGQPVSFQLDNPAGCTGTWSVEGTNEDPAVFASPASASSTSLYWGADIQPSGTAVATSIVLQATHENMRPRYTRVSGGTGALADCLCGLGAGGVLVMPPNVAGVSAADAATLASLVENAEALLALLP